MGSPRKVLRDIDPKKLEAGYTLDKGTVYCDGLLYLRKSTDNSLHFNGLRRMLFEIAYDSISLTMKLNIEGEFLGITSRTVKSSTYFALGTQDETRSLTIIASKREPSLVPWRIPQG